jgi:preprotein translocase subunit SecD
MKTQAPAAGSTAAILMIAMMAGAPTLAPAAIHPNPGLTIRLVDDSAGASHRTDEESAPWNGSKLWLEPETPITGSMIASAQAFVDASGPAVAFQMTPDGKASLAAFTAANVGRRVAFQVDGQVVAAPLIRDPMTQGAGMIMGRFTREQAAALAAEINAGRQGE